ncbi:uncharacterized protein LOC135372714 [Ornithodoros turicata]|uniref:uncharacterized protein LOC135372714 n=1 Tax=Ornithodoros turicata TaxID=34597 RepID=UPI0031386B31
MGSFLLRMFFFLICDLDRAFQGVSALDFVPVQDTNPHSTMHLWRPISVFFVGDARFRTLQDTVVMPDNVTEFYLYSQSMLNILAFMYRQEFPRCDIKLKSSGTYAMNDKEAAMYIPQKTNFFKEPDDDIVASDDLGSLQDFVEQITAASSADIVVALIRHTVYDFQDAEGFHNAWHNYTARMCSAQKLVVYQDVPYSYSHLDELMTAILSLIVPWSNEETTCRTLQKSYRDALTGQNGQVCYNTADTCCPPLFFGIFNMRKRPFCAQTHWVTTFDQEGHCRTQCWETEDSSLTLRWVGTPTGWVSNKTATYWTHSLVCPQPDDEVSIEFHIFCF